MKTKRILIVALMVMALSPATVATAAVKNWTDGSGNWNLGANWSGGTVPGLNDTVNIALADGAARTITYDVTAPNLGALTIDLTGAGTNRTTFAMAANNLTTIGFIVGSSGRATFDQQGGAVIANDPALDSIVGLNSGSDGIYNLSGAGSLSIARDLYVGASNSSTGAFNQTGGTNTITSRLLLGNAAGATGTYTISAGTLSTTTSILVGNSGDGTLTIQGTGSVFTDNLSINSQSDVFLSGGTLRFDTIGGAGGLSRLNYTAGTIQLTGARNLLTDFTIGTLFGADPTIPNGKGLTIEGVATISEIMPFQTVRVSGGSLSSQSRLEIGKLNHGALEITNGGIVACGEGRIALDFGATGTVTVIGPGSTWNLSDELWVGGQGSSAVLNIRGGALVYAATTLNLWADGVINLDGGTIRFNDYLRFINGTNDGVFNFNAGTIQLAGNRSIGSDATILDILGAATTLAAGKGLTVEGDATISSAVTLNGGTLRATNLIVNGAFHFGGGLLELTGGTITGLASLAAPTGGEFRATGVQSLRIAGAAGSTITATGNLTLGNASAVNGFYSDGTLSVGANTVTLNDANDAAFDSGALVTLGSGASPGAINAANGLTLDFGGNITGFGALSTPNNLAKPLINNGHITGTSPAQRITLPGYVKGVGTFDNVNITGTFSPGLSPTILSVGNVTFSPTSTLIMELGGASPGSGYDQIQSSGVLSLGGRLEISLINGFVPSAGQTFDILNGGSLAGAFSSVELPTLPGLAWNTAQLATGMLSVVPGLPGDFNGDGSVNGADLANWSAGFGTPSGATHMQGDADADEDVDGADFLVWQRQLGSVTAGEQASAAVPEPSTITLLACALAPALASRLAANRRRRQPN